MRVDGDRIRLLRENAGHGLRAFATLADVSPSHLSMIERGERDASPQVASRIANALGVAIADLRV